MTPNNLLPKKSLHCEGNACYLLKAIKNKDLELKSVFVVHLQCILIN